MNGEVIISSHQYLDSIAENIGASLNKSIQFKHIESLGGGCINQVSKITDDKGNRWLLKENSPSLLDMFIAEAQGLEEIKQSKSIRVPDVICYGETSNKSYLVLEYITLSEASGNHKTAEKLALMHQCQSPTFGWYRDNTIGTTPQNNQPTDSWISFWQEQRLLAQLNLALTNAYPKKAYDDGIKLVEKIALFFDTYQPIPSLLHGDLWGGNHAFDSNNQAVIFDPAVYYGDRETDIAMTELFGGFDASFYARYNECFQLDEGYAVRKTLYNLYHTLNHYNLFGGGYASQAANMTRRLLAEL